MDQKKHETTQVDSVCKVELNQSEINLISALALKELAIKKQTIDFDESSLEEQTELVSLVNKLSIYYGEK
jgi:hypothetical protein